jgi:hypothetical protein
MPSSLCLEGLHAEVEEITELADDRIFGVGRSHGPRQGQWGAGGAPLLTVLWFAEDKITRRQVSWNRDETLEAAGLRE